MAILAAFIRRHFRPASISALFSNAKEQIHACVHFEGQMRGREGRREEERGDLNAVLLQTRRRHRRPKEPSRVPVAEISSVTPTKTTDLLLAFSQPINLECVWGERNLEAVAEEPTWPEV